MKRILGMGVGVFYVGLTWGALAKANAGWASGHGDLGFWWAFIAAFLAVAAGGALIGTWIHTRKTES
jgi:hypothetical protein